MTAFVKSASELIGAFAVFLTALQVTGVLERLWPAETVTVIREFCWTKKNGKVVCEEQIEQMPPLAAAGGPLRAAPRVQATDTLGPTSGPELPVPSNEIDAAVIVGFGIAIVLMIVVYVAIREFWESR